jgi:hypothetical protein
VHVLDGVGHGDKIESPPVRVRVGEPALAHVESPGSRILHHDGIRIDTAALPTGKGCQVQEVAVAEAHVEDIAGPVARQAAQRLVQRPRQEGRGNCAGDALHPRHALRLYPAHRHEPRECCPAQRVLPTPARTVGLTQISG